jgi:hypothetical protein
MTKNKLKNPYLNFTLDELARAESCCYAIQLGNDFYSHNDQCVFKKSQIIRHYNKILDELVYLLNNGSEKEKKKARFYIERFHVHPLRVH